MKHMELSRRGFVVAGGVAMAGLLVGCGAGAGVGSGFASGVAGDSAAASDIPANEPNPLAAFEYRHFDRLVGADVRMSDGVGQADVTILETIDHQHLNDEAPELGTREPFSVVLEGPADFCPQEGRYEITHPELGTVELFMLYMGPHEAETVVGSTVQRNRYEAHFN